MNINDYLKELRECPDEELGEKVIRDNSKILVGTDYEPLKELIKTVPSLSFQGEFDGIPCRAAEFFYKPGTVLVDVRNDALFWGNDSEEGQPYFEIMRKNYHSSLSFHSEQGEPASWKKGDIGKIMEGVHPDRAIALCAIDILKHVKDKVSLCIDEIRRLRNADDYSLIIWHPETYSPR